MARMNNQVPSAQGVGAAHQKLQSNVRALKGVGGFLIVMGIGALALLNCQPHFTLAREIAKEITVVPFLNWLTQLPLIGGWIAFIAVNAVAVLGLILWAFTQYFQILPLLVENPSQRLQSFRGFAYGYEVLVCFLQFPPYEGGASAFLDDFGVWDVDLIDWWHLVLFLVSIVFFEVAVLTIIEVNKAFR